MNTTPRVRKPIIRFETLFRHSINRAYNIFIAPRSDSEDSRRHEVILNTILCCIIPFVVCLDGVIVRDEIVQGAHYHGISFPYFSCIVLVFLYLLLLSRKGYYRLSAYVFLLAYFICTTYGAMRWGVELPLVAISYIVIIVISSLIVSTRFSLLTAVIITSSVVGITYFQTTQLLHPVLSWKYHIISMSDSMELSLVFFIITSVSWLSNREMERSLRRAHNSEQALLQERDLLEIKVEERTKELKDSQEEKVSQLYRFAEFGKLSSGIFHDLMNTLHTVTLNVAELERSPDHIGEVRQHLNKAVAASKRLGESISTVRKQIADDTSMSIFSLEKEITDAVDILHFKARENNVSFKVTIKDRVSLHGNAVKFYQVILNLLSNAVDACEQHMHPGIVAVTVRLASRKKKVVILIRDNGCGIEPAILETIFTPFFTTKTYGKGMGLGLSQTKTIIEHEFKGTIKVSSTVSKGTTFIISLPLIIDNDNGAEQSYPNSLP